MNVDNRNSTPSVSSSYDDDSSSNPGGRPAFDDHANGGYGKNADSILSGGGSGSGSSQSSSAMNTNEYTSDGSSSQLRDNVFAQSETRHIFWLRLVVFLMLLIATVSISFIVFSNARQSEEDEFSFAFEDHAGTILDAFETHWTNGMSAIDTLAISILGYSQDMAYANAVAQGEAVTPTSIWPMVDVPFFEHKAAAARRLGRFTTVTVMPYITDDDDRRRYEVFASNPGNREWVERGIEFQNVTGQSEWKFGNFPSNDKVDDPAEGEVTDEASSGTRQLVSLSLEAFFDNLPTFYSDDNSDRPKNLPPFYPVRHDSRKIQQNGSDGVQGLSHEPSPLDLLRLDIADNGHSEILWGTLPGSFQLGHLPYNGGPYYPAWQHSPIDGFVNYDVGTDRVVGGELEMVSNTKSILISRAVFLNNVINTTNGQTLTETPASIIRYPLIEHLDGVSPDRLVGILDASIYWDAYMQVGRLPSTADGIHIVLTNGPQCNQTYTFDVIDGDVLFRGSGDLHETEYDDTRVSFELASLFAPQAGRDSGRGSSSSTADTFSSLGYSPVPFNTDHCPYVLNIYASKANEQQFLTKDPYWATGVVVGVFLLTSLIFVGYDWYVERRQRLVMQTAVQSHTIVSSLFPKNVRQRLLDEAMQSGGHGGADRKGMSQSAATTLTPTPSMLDAPLSQKAKLKNYISKGTAAPPAASTQSSRRRRNDPSGTSMTAVPHGHPSMFDAYTGTASGKTKPIADLFPSATVLFADICGFTAWSSMRAPTDVFTLLESIYGAFDVLAEKRRVFKVETIGDCFLAVTGLPDPQEDHALIMAKFACAALLKMGEITRQLEIELGPDTAELSIRIGLHSGPVTAGVLRGQKSRFQLFGDTVNTASRMESTCEPGRIQCSQQTADLLVQHGKMHWVVPREDEVHAKGKGTIRTFWIQPRGVYGRRSDEGSVVSVTSHMHRSDDAKSRSSLGITSAAVAVAAASNGNKTASGVGQKSGKLSHKERLLEWNVDLLSLLLTKVKAHNLTTKRRKSTMGMAGLGSRKSSAGSANGSSSSSSSNKGNNKGNSNKGNSEARSAVGSDDAMGLTGNPRDEYREAIRMPAFEDVAATTAEGIGGSVDPASVELSPTVREQLRDYVSKIAESYHDNAFHNYDHASHVTMSANKILCRVVAIDNIDHAAGTSDRQERGSGSGSGRGRSRVRGTTSSLLSRGRKSTMTTVTESSSSSSDGDGNNDDDNQHNEPGNDLKTAAAKLHDYTYGITSDPLTHFACVFSALIHDVDHPGVPNMQLVRENSELAAMYGNRSVAEQNSIDLAWTLLMDDRYTELRDCLFDGHDAGKQRRFRQLLVNTVMATDIFDPELKAMRNQRWNKAFAASAGAADGISSSSSDAGVTNKDLKATIVIEHIIQAADVGHTMQHWHVYQKWNRRLFREMYGAYKNGRLASDPSTGWYRGELWFYDNYIIPLAKKLNECGVFGVSSDEFLNYATMNRAEWERKGEGIVEQLRAEYERDMADEIKRSQHSQ